MSNELVNFFKTVLTEAGEKMTGSPTGKPRVTVVTFGHFGSRLELGFLREDSLGRNKPGNKVQPLWIDSRESRSECEGRVFAGVRYSSLDVLSFGDHDILPKETVKSFENKNSDAIDVIEVTIIKRSGQTWIGDYKSQSESFKAWASGNDKVVLLGGTAVKFDKILAKLVLAIRDYIVKHQ